MGGDEDRVALQKKIRQLKAQVHFTQEERMREHVLQQDALQADRRAHEALKLVPSLFRPLSLSISLNLSQSLSMSLSLSHTQTHTNTHLCVCVCVRACACARLCV